MTIFFLVLLFIIIVSSILINASTFKINIKTFELLNKDILNFEIIISLNLFKKIKWLAIKIDKENIKDLKGNIKLNFINKILDTKVLKKYKSINQILSKDGKVILNELKRFNIEGLNLKAKIGTDNPEITAYLVAIISSILAIFLAKKISNPIYIIEPKYNNQSFIYLNLSFIISIRLKNIMKVFNKKNF